MTSLRSCRLLPRLHLIAFFYWTIHLALGGEVNVTVDDTDPSIVYQPPESWQASSTTCSMCLDSEVRDAYLGTYHNGTHVVPSVDADDAAGSTDEAEAANSGKGKSGNSGKGRGGPGPRQIRHARSSAYRRTDADDPGFLDTNVTVEFRFTGTAVYLYSIQPLGLPLLNTTPTAMNLTFNLDNTTHETFLHQGSDADTGYLSSVNVFSKFGLSDASHVLRVDVGPSSVFLFDYMIYTRSTPSTPLAQDLPMPSETINPSSFAPLLRGGVIEVDHLTFTRSTKRHNIATFAGAVGGSVGVLALISLCLAFSIIKRRRNYERRERLSHRESSLHTNGSDDSPPAAGPAPFVPRYFPGTHVPADPPPYVESLTSPGVHLARRSQDRSYADVPPASPPPPLDDYVLQPPPPFGVAIAFRPPREAAGDSTRPTEDTGATVHHSTGLTTPCSSQNPLS
ncbi:hypothetical protein LshimejAT787_1602090 [Lyophyllum shimeji]|uniref:Uncharacterized protein n=1 Tax=Lyophyllum shimeji TaxID=47721 RepID=A0A9P3PZC7_LYOSH|nr:hypothetical protein LshimejAT787_1602090 [Lyophyllum shimeji]